MTADNHQVDLLVSKECICFSVVLDVWVIYSTVLALGVVGGIRWRCGALKKGVDPERWVWKNEGEMEACCTGISWSILLEDTTQDASRLAGENA